LVVHLMWQCFPILPLKVEYIFRIC